MCPRGIYFGLKVAPLRFSSFYYMGTWTLEESVWIVQRIRGKSCLQTLQPQIPKPCRPDLDPK